MKKIIILIMLSFLIFLSSCDLKQNNDIIKKKTESSKSLMTELEARVIAEKTCIKWWESLAPGYYNENTKTWWFDANLNSTKEWCNPACVVSENTKTAEINWRCTGLISPKESTTEILTNLFREKYPKYKDTIIVKIDKETSEHARGWIIFVNWAPGWYFLAAKIDWEWQIILDWNGQISCGLSKYGFPENMLFDCSEEYEIDLSYQDIINYLNYNITDILTKYSEIKPENWQWFADWFGFTSINNVYVDYEDWHYLYRALLECDNKNNIILCNPLAIFEKQKSWWIVIQWEDTQKNNEIIYKWAKDYEWER